MKNKLYYMAVILFLISTPVFIASSEIDENTFNNTVSNFFQHLTNLLNPVAEFALKFSIQLARVVYTLSAIVGMIFWASHWNRPFGKELILGAIALAIMVEILQVVT